MCRTYIKNLLRPTEFISSLYKSYFGIWNDSINPLLPSAATQCQNFNLRWDHKKNSFERSDYESVDEKSLS